MSDSKTPISIMIGVPSFRGTIMVNTTGSLLRLVGLCNDIGIKVNFVNVDSAEVIRARNTIASHFIRSPEFSHLLFIDDDMGFEADAILDLVRANKDVIGAVCPKRVLDLEKIYAAAQRGDSLESAITEGLSFVTRHLPTEKIEVKEGLIKVAGIGMAVTLIKRQVFQKLIDNKLVAETPVPDASGTDAFGHNHHYGFFDPLPDSQTGSMLSEDLAFCERWRVQLGGEIWALTSRRISHIGMYDYAGTYLTRLKSGKP
jgi:hypothetical protein